MAFILVVAGRFIGSDNIDPEDDDDEDIGI